MPIIPTAKGPVTFCVLIPSRGRPETLAKSLGKMPWLNTSDTYIGFEHREESKYSGVLRGTRMHLVRYPNPLGSVAHARERLRRYAMEDRKLTHFVVTDDNAVHRSEEGLHNLVRACAEWPTPCTMAGMHNTAEHFDRGKLGQTKTRHGLRSYPSVAAIFQCYPRSLYESFTYPEEAYGLDDRYYYLWLLSQGHTAFRVCRDAPFTKSRYQPGGQGSLDERAEKCGRAIARLAGDFPKLVGAVGTLRIPWQHLIKTVQAGGTITGNRLVGGAMRKEGTLQRSGMRIKVRRIKRRASQSK